MKCDEWESGTIKCELCSKRLPFILQYTWNRSDEFGGHLTMKLCASCEKEFRKKTNELTSRARKILDDEYELWLNHIKQEKLLEKRQLKLLTV